MYRCVCGPFSYLEILLLYMTNFYVSRNYSVLYTQPNICFPQISPRIIYNISQSPKLTTLRLAVEDGRVRLLHSWHHVHGHCLQSELGSGMGEGGRRRRGRRRGRGRGEEGGGGERKVCA